MGLVMNFFFIDCVEYGVDGKFICFELVEE